MQSSFIRDDSINRHCSNFEAAVGAGNTPSLVWIHVHLSANSLTHRASTRAYLAEGHLPCTRMVTSCSSAIVSQVFISFTVADEGQKQIFKKISCTSMGQAMLRNASAGYANVSTISTGMRESSTRNHNSKLLDLRINIGGCCKVCSVLIRPCCHQKTFC